MKRLAAGREGYLTVEACILFPFVIVFLLALHCLIQLSAVEMNLKTTVGESVKVMAANLYPVDVLYQEAKTQAGGTQAGAWAKEAWTRAVQAREAVKQAEDWADEYAAYLPDIAVTLLEWEAAKREALETTAGSVLEDKILQPMLQKAFRPVVYGFADERILKKDRFRLVRVKLPDLEHPENAYLAIEAEYEFLLPVPFMSKTVTLKQQAMERAWIGE
ncbi:hypothetical protein J31TS4_05760 [Paenibacillus sp. J31TS4]|uniref:hypothetical protein n=1 Tax=Paenibacillus sp. J31TS4 TaxID=2807195 RepID=UPI001B1ECABB|nr:hypothetical protein [Paenibacillus sp. J31TS4]GIP37296.1 hypothetical protein J31TS4_05760 [Paenibacillus sp. J31TS4]